MKQVSFRADEILLVKLDILAKAAGMSREQWLRSAVEQGATNLAHTNDKAIEAYYLAARQAEDDQLFSEYQTRIRQHEVENLALRARRA